MSPGQLLAFILILGLISLSISRPLSDEDKKKLLKQQPKWKSPAIDEILEGSVSKKGRVSTYLLKYKNNKEKKICDVTYKEKRLPDGMVESQHKWKCKQQPEKADPDLTGKDYS